MLAVAWRDLVVVATAVPAGGFAIHAPIVRDPAGRLFMVTDVDAETVVPRHTIDPREYDEYLAGGGWLALPGWLACRQAVIVVAARPLVEAARDAGAPPPWEWYEVGEMRVSYVAGEAALAWRRRAGEALLAVVEEQVVEYLAFKEALALERAENTLRHVHYLCERSQYMHLFELYGVVLRQVDPSRWPKVARIALTQVPSLERSVLEEGVRRRAWELEEAAETKRRRGASSSWGQRRSGQPTAPPKLWGKAA
ncbi:MAG TPA: hypothetical protein VH877_09065 [Polyangia bacterium]|jgi:hypothetical protein|nr:hypothetical protein [Polyangia bacterium]